MGTPTASRLRELPQVDALARDPALAPFPEAVRRRAARHAVEESRAILLAGGEPGTPADRAASLALAFTATRLRPLVNMTGVVLHTGLGRARLAPEAVRQVADVAANHALLEFDLESGERGDRQSHVRDHLIDLTGAEDALVVNNAAAGVILALATVAEGGEVVLSRGQMVEIGGAFRMPEIIRRAGCRMVEVGCTNKTRLSDYDEVTTIDTRAYLRCHTSNYTIVGFSETPDTAALSGLARKHDVAMIDDQGTGCLIDLTRFGLPATPTLPGSVAAGADLSIASGDKLLGGPQAGIIVGRKEFVGACKRHPLARAFRIDKLSLAALEATLRLYVTGRESEIPTIKYLDRTVDDLLEIASAIGGERVESRCEVGAGSSPGTSIPSIAMALPESRALELRSKGIVGRVERGRLLLDVRCVEESEIPQIREAIG